jgi:hypothetical protein
MRVAQVGCVQWAFPQELNRQPLGPGRGCEQGARLRQDERRLQRNLLQLQFIGLDFGQIQDAIDDGQQAMPNVDHYAGVLDSFSVRDIGLRQHLREPQHASHGCANFMTHGSQKAALG